MGIKQDQMSSLTLTKLNTTYFCEHCMQATQPFKKYSFRPLKSILTEINRFPTTHAPLQIYRPNNTNSIRHFTCRYSGYFFKLH